MFFVLGPKTWIVLTDTVTILDPKQLTVTSHDSTDSDPRFTSSVERVHMEFTTHFGGIEQ